MYYTEMFIFKFESANFLVYFYFILFILFLFTYFNLILISAAHFYACICNKLCGLNRQKFTFTNTVNAKE